MDTITAAVEDALASGNAERALGLCLENNVSCLHGSSIERLRAMRRDQPSFLLIAMRRSGSTYVAKSVQTSAGYLNIPYSRVADDDTALNHRLNWLKLGGVMARIHSRPTPQVLDAIGSLGPVRLMVLQRDPVDAAFSLYVRRRYNPRRIDEDKSPLSVNRLETVPKNLFMDFMEPAIEDFRAWSMEWTAQRHRIFPMAIHTDYASFYKHETTGFAEIQAHLNLVDRIVPMARNTISNYQRDLTTERGEIYREWLTELR